MTCSIEFIENISETALPIIKLTRSPNKETGTATFIFFYKEMQIKQYCFEDSKLIKGMLLRWHTNFIFTKNIEIIFDNGHPFLIKSIILLKDSKEWFHFLNFMFYYSNDTGLFFEETLI